MKIHWWTSISLEILWSRALTISRIQIDGASLWREWPLTVLRTWECPPELPPPPFISPPFWNYSPVCWRSPFPWFLPFWCFSSLLWRFCGPGPSLLLTASPRNLAGDCQSSWLWLWAWIWAQHWPCQWEARWGASIVLLLCQIPFWTIWILEQCPKWWQIVPIWWTVYEAAVASIEKSRAKVSNGSI